MLRNAVDDVRSGADRVLFDRQNEADDIGLPVRSRTPARFGRYGIRAEAVDKPLTPPDVGAVVNLTIPDAHFAAASRDLTLGCTPRTPFSAVRKREPRCSLDGALHALEVMAGILQSGETGSLVVMRTTCARPAPLGPDEAMALLLDPAVGHIMAVGAQS